MKSWVNSSFIMPALVLGFSFVVAGQASAQTFTILHSFPNLVRGVATNSDGNGPFGLVLSGNTLYGTTLSGGSYGEGTVFAVKTDGTGFSTLHSFSALVQYAGDNIGNGTNSDGASPSAGLILSDNSLYGATCYGGSFGGGTVFRLNTDGTGFTVLHGFSPAPSSLGALGTNSDGTAPMGRLTLSQDTLYGTASLGGFGGHGTVFKVNTDGTGFTRLYTFSGGDAATPTSGLALAGATLYGTTDYGDNAMIGTLFSVNINGAGFSVLHTFNDGALPRALIVLRNMIYGTTGAGGTFSNGTVFAVKTDGSGFTNLYTFTATSSYNSFAYPINSDGAGPYGLVLSGNTIYGITGTGGSSGYGTVFRFNVNGMAFTVLHTFSFGSDGARQRS